MGEPGVFIQSTTTICGKSPSNTTPRHISPPSNSADLRRPPRENETTLPEAKQQRSKLLDKIHFGTFEFDALFETLSEIVEWSTTTTDVLPPTNSLNSPTMLGELLRRAKQKALKPLNWFAKRWKKSFGKHRRAEQTVKPIIAAHLDAFVEASLPSRPTF